MLDFLTLSSSDLFPSLLFYIALISIQSKSKKEVPLFSGFEVFRGNPREFISHFLLQIVIQNQKEYSNSFLGSSQTLNFFPSVDFDEYKKL